LPLVLQGHKQHTQQHTVVTLPSFTKKDRRRAGLGVSVCAFRCTLAKLLISFPHCLQQCAQSSQVVCNVTSQSHSRCVALPASRLRVELRRPPHTPGNVTLPAVPCIVQRPPRFPIPEGTGPVQLPPPQAAKGIWHCICCCRVGLVLTGWRVLP
jgi:hypothetical protein